MGGTLRRKEYVEESAITDFVEGVRLDLRKLVLHIIGIHCPNLLSGWGTEHFNDFHKLINARLPGEQWLSKHKLCHYATRRPYVCYTSFSMLNKRHVRLNVPILVV